MCDSKVLLLQRCEMVKGSEMLQFGYDRLFVSGRDLFAIQLNIMD